MMWLLLLVSLSFAVFPVNDYIKDGEQISFENFSVNGHHYSLVFINDKASFLLRDGELVNESDEIAHVLKQYALEQSVVSQSLLDDMEAALLSFNESRNDGAGRWAGTGYEEYLCRQALFLNTLPCNNEENCTYAAKVLCSYMADFDACDDYHNIYQPLVDFATASFGLDNVVAHVLKLIKQLKNGFDKDDIAALKQDVELLENYTDVLEHSAFRTPEYGEQCDDCIGLCPSIAFNHSALERLKLGVNNLSAVLDNYNTYENYVPVIVEETAARLEWKKNKDTYDEMSERLNGLRQQFDEVRKEALGVGVRDVILNTYVSEAETCLSNASSLLDDYSFKEAQDVMLDCPVLFNKVKKRVSYLHQLEREEGDVEANATYLTYLYASLAKRPTDVADAQLLIAKLQKMKAQPHDTVSALSSLKAKFEEMNNELSVKVKAVRSELKNVPYVVMFLFTFFANTHKFTLWLVSLNVLPDSVLNTVQSIESNLLLTACVAIGLTFLYVLFVFSFVAMRFTDELKLLLPTVLLLSAAIVLPLVLYNVTNSYTGEMNLFVFNTLLQAQQPIVILVEDEVAKQCAQSFARYLSDKGKVVLVAFKQGNTCKDVMGRVMSCKTLEDEAHFVLTKSQSFTLSFDRRSLLQVRVNGNADFYTGCYLPFIFEVE